MPGDNEVAALRRYVGEYRGYSVLGCVVYGLDALLTEVELHRRERQQGGTACR